MGAFTEGHTGMYTKIFGAPHFLGQTGHAQAACTMFTLYGLKMRLDTPQMVQVYRSRIKVTWFQKRKRTHCF